VSGGLVYVYKRQGDHLVGVEGPVFFVERPQPLPRKDHSAPLA
jgi:hypothetical protein